MPHRSISLLQSMNPETNERNNVALKILRFIHTESNRPNTATTTAMAMSMYRLAVRCEARIISGVSFL